MGDTGKARRGDAGETLIEALVVMAIIGLVAAIGFPQIQQALLAFSWNQTVASVAEQLRRARAEALRRDSPVVFAVSGGGRTYAATGGASRVVPPGVILSYSGANGDRIVFYGDGSSSGGWVRVSAGRRGAALTVTPGSGVIALARS